MESVGLLEDDDVKDSSNKQMKSIRCVPQPDLPRVTKTK